MSQKIVEYATLALWSVCYGIPENINTTLDLNAVPTLIEILKIKKPFRLPYAAAGALWKLAEESRGCEIIYNNGAFDLLEDLTKRGKDDCIVPCLALGTIVTNGINLKISPEKLDCIHTFLVTKNPLTFPHKFVWTTVKPLKDLLECEHEPVKLLGTFLALVTIKAQAATATLFMEGAIKLLKDIALSAPDHTAISNFSITALKELGITITKSQPQTTQEQFLDIVSWLESVQLSAYLPVFQKHCITWDTLVHLSTEDLSSMEIPIGPRKQLLQLIDSIKRGNYGTVSPVPVKRSPLSDSDDDSCLICCSFPREMCFVQCGHVVTCEQCSEVLIAKHAKCIVCRSEIVMSIKPKFI
jgi:hypothetical protein